MQPNKDHRWRQFWQRQWLAILFLAVLAIGVRHTLRGGHSVDISTHWGLYSLSLRKLILVIPLAYLITLGVYMIVSLLFGLVDQSASVAVDGFLGRVAHHIRMGVIVALVALGGLNYYVEIAHPMAYAQRTVNGYLQAQDTTSLAQLSGTTTTYHRLKGVESLHLHREDAGTNRTLTYAGTLDDARQRPVNVTVSRHRVGPLGLYVTYAVKEIDAG